MKVKGDFMKPNVTFVMLKPDALEKHAVDTIVSYFEKNGLRVDSFGVQLATRERITAHYGEHFKRLGPEFERKMLSEFVGRPVLPAVVHGEGDVVTAVRGIVGATEPAKAEKGTIRGDLGEGDSFERAQAENRAVRNVIHASDSACAVERELSIWLPDYKLN